MYEMDARTRALVLTSLLGGIFWLQSCGRGALEPSPLAINETASSRCRMAISQERFSAQIVGEDGRVEFFDDLGCLLNWIRQTPIPDSVSVFVVDYRTGKWLPAAEATFLQGSRIQTPMGFGVIAVETVEEAQRIGLEAGGTPLNWQEALKIDG